MDISSFLKLVTDIALWYAVSGSVLFTLGEVELLPFAAVLAVSGTLSALLTGKRMLFRLAPSALLLISIAFVSNLIEALFIVPISAYIVFEAATDRFEPQYESFIDIFKLLAAIVPALLFLLLMFGDKVAVATIGLPSAIVFFVCSVALLRVLRHDKSIRREPRFVLVSLLAPALSLIAAVAMSRPEVLSIAGAVFGFIYERVISPLILAVSYVIFGIIWLIGKLIELATGEPRPREDFEQIELGEGSENPMEYFTNEPNKTVESVFISLGIIAFLLIAFWIFKKLIGERRAALSSAAQSNAVRERSGAVYAPLRAERLRASVPDEAVRICFRKYMELIVKAGGSIVPSNTTSDILRSTGEPFLAEAEAELRALYIRARYSPTPLERADAKRARALSRDIQKAAREKRSRS